MIPRNSFFFVDACPSSSLIRLIVNCFFTSLLYLFFGFFAVLSLCGIALYYFQIQLHHLLAPFPFWRPLIPLSVALLRCVSFTLARMKNSRRILVHFYLEIVLETCAAGRTQNAAPSDEFGGGGAQNGSLPKSRISSDRGKGVREGRLPPSSAFACEIAYHTSSR